jgi:hypothetical protein
LANEICSATRVKVRDRGERTVRSLVSSQISSRFTPSDLWNRMCYKFCPCVIAVASRPRSGRTAIGTKRTKAAGSDNVRFRVEMCCRTLVFPASEGHLQLENSWLVWVHPGGAPQHQRLTPTPDATHAVRSAVGGGLRQIGLASRRKFCAVAVSNTSSLAPLKPRSRNRSSLRSRGSGRAENVEWCGISSSRSSLQNQR